MIFYRMCLHVPRLQQKGDFKIINNVNKFFDYWIAFIIKGGTKLSRKIMKLVADKFNLKEDEMEIHDKLLEDLTRKLF